MPTVITIPTFNVVANVEKDSPARTLVSTITSLFVQLTDDAGMWGTTVGNITQWGMQYSKDGGVTWNWGPVWQTNIPFGTQVKGGGLPTLGAASSVLLQAVNDQIRLAIVTDANITLGATVTVN